MTSPPRAWSSSISARKTRFRLAVRNSEARCEPSSSASASVSGVKPEMSANTAAPLARVGSSSPAASARRRSRGMYAQVGSTDLSVAARSCA